MIIGRLLVGSVLGGISALIALLTGQPVGAAAMIWISTGVLSVLVIALACAFRPRKSSSGDFAANAPKISSNH